MTNDFTEEGPFRQAVKAALMALLDQVDDIDSDEHDPSMTDGNLKVVFEDGSTFVLSQQPPRIHNNEMLILSFSWLHFSCGHHFLGHSVWPGGMREAIK